MEGHQSDYDRPRPQTADLSSAVYGDEHFPGQTDVQTIEGRACTGQLALYELISCTNTDVW